MLRSLALVPIMLVAPAPWDWPVAPPHDIVRPWIAPPTPYAAGHRGIDIAALDPAVRAPADGIVHFAGVVVDRPVLSVRHPGGVITSYEPVETTLVAGEPVRRGDVIGDVMEGHCASRCLHFGVRVDGEYVSPMRWLGGIPRAVLLPTRRQTSTAHGGEYTDRHTPAPWAAVSGRALASARVVQIIEVPRKRP